MSKENGMKIADKAKRQIAMLVVIFLAGMAVNVIGMPSEVKDTEMTISAVLTGLHVLIGIGLITGGIITLRVAYKEAASFIRLAWIGFASVLVAFASGMIMMATENDWWSFIMAASFLAAFLAYGSVMVRAQKA